jgi:tetratricopeptide (TPR) repeat protein
MAKLFLSYAREDAAIAERLARALERGDEHDVWWDRDLHGGASFGAEIEQQLRDCDVVIVLWSPAGIQSPWVRDEAAIGRDTRKLIPVSMGAVEPPIGFRQFHTIDIGPHGRASGAAIEKIRQSIERVAGAGAQESAAPPPPKARSGRRSTGRLALAAGAAALVIAVGAGLYVWSQQPRELTVAIVPAAGQPGAAGEYANSIATDMAAFLSAHGNAASVLDPTDPEVQRATYRFSVAYSGQGPGADTSLSMAAAGQQGIAWSRSWSASDVSSVDLKKQMSFAASRALLCALEAERDGTRLSPSVFKLYIVACSGFESSEIPETQLESDFSQIVAQEPRFAPGWQNLALVRTDLVIETQLGGGIAPPALRNSAVQALARARQLTPNSGKILLAEAGLVDPDWQRQLPLLDRAIALEPNEATYYAIRSSALQHVGRMQDAVADCDKATQLDPLSPGAAGQKIFALMYAAKLDEAKEQLAAAYKLWPNNVEMQQADFALSLRYGDPRHAEQLLSKTRFGDSNTADAQRKVLMARENPTPSNVDGAVGAWRLAVTSNPRRMPQYLLALGTFGRMDQAFQLMSDAKARRFIDPQIFFRPEFNAIRHDPRFMAVAAQYGLVRYWRSTGQWPDFCGDAGLSYDCKAEAAKYVG